MGDESKAKVMIIDTPGLFDNEQARVDEIITGENAKNDFIGDMTVKLRAVGKIHAIIVLMNLVGRLDLTFMKTMEAVNDMFEQNDCCLSKNFIFAFARCDEDNRGNFAHIVKDRVQVYSKIYDTLVKSELTVTQRFPDNLFFLSSKNPNATTVSQSNEFERLYEVLGNCPDLDTSQIQCPQEYMNSNFFIYLFIWLIDVNTLKHHNCQDII